MRCAQAVSSCHSLPLASRATSPSRGEAKRGARRGEKWQRQSSGSTFTKAWAWFEPTQNDTGVVELST